MKETNSKDNYDAQTLLLNDSNGNEIFCYLEQLVSVEGQEYALLTPVDTPVSLFKINEIGLVLLWVFHLIRKVK